MDLNSLASYISLANKAISEKQFSKAASLSQRALKINPNLSEAWYNLGLAYAGMQNTTEATNAFIQASRAAPFSSEAQSAIGLEYIKLGLESDAEACLELAHRLDPNAYEPYCNLGFLRRNQNRLNEAASLIIKSISLAPNVSILYSNLAGILIRLEKYEEAVLSSKKAIELDPQLADAWNNLSIAHSGLRQHGDSVLAAKNAQVLNPQQTWLIGNIIESKLKMCQWDDFNESLELIKDKVHSKTLCAEPGLLFSLTDDGFLQKEYAVSFSQKSFKSCAKNKKHTNNDRIRVGYISSDFRNHAVTFLITGIIEEHDRNKFEIHGFDTKNSSNSSHRDRILRLFDKNHDVHGKTPREIIELIQKNKIDILIDLNGYTVGAVTEVLAARPAGIQINYIGYPGTMGCDFIDYIIGDGTVTPLDKSSEFTEKIILLPECFQPNDQKRTIAEKRTRSDYGLPEGEFIFACFNQPTKLNPNIFNAWISILLASPNSRLWLAIHDQTAQDNIICSAVAQGLKKDRIIFASQVDYDEHLMRHQLVDLMLDTFPFGGGTTTSDALWTGTPIITIKGNSFASRMSTSLLKCIGATDLISASIDEYCSLAIELYKNCGKLNEVRNTIKTNRDSTSLFNTKRYTKHLENGLIEAFERYRSGQHPEHIIVSEIKTD